MNVRGRLAQSLKLKLKRRATAAARPRAHAWSASDSSVLRFTRRWGSALLELKVPRGAGASAAAMLLLASTYYGVVKGGHAPAIAAQIQDICDAAANSAGFRISEIALAGEHEVSREDILEPGRHHRPLVAAVPRCRADAHPAADQSVDRASRGAQALSRPAAHRDQGAPGVRAVAEGRPRLTDRRRRHRAGNLRAAALRRAAAGGRQRRRACGAGFSRPAQALSGDRAGGRGLGAGRRAALEPASEKRRRSAACPSASPRTR